MCLASISYNEQGKSDVVEKGGVQPLCKHILDSVPAVREAVVLCLCSLSQINSGKNQIIAGGNFEAISSLLNDPSKHIELIRSYLSLT